MGESPSAEACELQTGAEVMKTHLSLSVVLIVDLFGGGDQVQHVGADQKGAEPAEIAVVLIFD